MGEERDYITVNKANWDERAQQHVNSSGYCYRRQLQDPHLLSEVVQFDLPLLGSLTNVSIIHLQCHIATDTLSLARLGAKEVVGLDFSPEALKQARYLADHAAGGEKLRFVEASVDDALTVLQPAAYDLVYTGIGALCWLPDIKCWARIVAALLKPGGRLFIREGHPLLFAIDDTITSAPTIGYPYFELEKPTEFDEGGTYVETEHVFQNTKTVEWNHGIGEILQAVIEAGMVVNGLVEHRSVPWCALPGRMKATGPLGEWELKQGKDNMPLSYTLQAVKPKRWHC